MMDKKTLKQNLILLLIVVVIIIIPLVFVKDTEFAGADGHASEIIEEMKNGFEPWAKPILEPPGGETESLLFALQAAIGSGIIFYCIGFLKGKNKNSVEELDKI